MLLLANDYRNRREPLTIGASFDRNNDLWLVDEKTVMHRDGYVTEGHPSNVTSVALLDYNRRHMRPDVFGEWFSAMLFVWDAQN